MNEPLFINMENKNKTNKKTISKSLLENIIRACINEVFDAYPQGIQEVDDAGDANADIGNSAPPVFTSDTRGIFFVDPNNPLKPTNLKNMTLKPDAQLERELYRLAAQSAGPRVKIANSTLRNLKVYLQSPTSTFFLYVGKQDPSDEDLYLLSTKSFQAAKEGSVSGDEKAEHPVTAIPDSSVQDASPRPSVTGKIDAPNLDEKKKFRNMISSMIKEILSERQ